MTTLELEVEPIAINVHCSDELLSVTLEDGRTISVPLDWYPRLHHASPAERNRWELLGDGYAIEWPDVDEHIGVEGLLAGRRSGENAESLKRWFSTRRRHSP